VLILNGQLQNIIIMGLHSKRCRLLLFIFRYCFVAHKCVCVFIFHHRYALYSVNLLIKDCRCFVIVYLVSKYKEVECCSIEKWSSNSSVVCANGLFGKILVLCNQFTWSKCETHFGGNVGNCLITTFVECGIKNSSFGVSCLRDLLCFFRLNREPMTAAMLNCFWPMGFLYFVVVNCFF